MADLGQYHGGRIDDENPKRQARKAGKRNAKETTAGKAAPKEKGKAKAEDSSD